MVTSRTKSENDYHHVKCLIQNFVLLLSSFGTSITNQQLLPLDREFAIVYYLLQNWCQFMMRFIFVKKALSS